MGIKFLSTLCISIVIGLSACSNESDSSSNESVAKNDVSYYVSNPKIAYQVVDDCKKKVANHSDNEIVFSQGDCKNAMLAKQEIIQKRNKTSSKEMPTYDFSNLNKNTKE